MAAEWADRVIGLASVVARRSIPAVRIRIRAVRRSWYYTPTRPGRASGTITLASRSGRGMPAGLAHEVAHHIAWHLSGGARDACLHGEYYYRMLRMVVELGGMDDSYPWQTEYKRIARRAMREA